MTGPAPAAAAAVFAVTFFLLALGRFGPWPVPRGAAALAGGLLTKLLVDVPWSAIDVQVLLLLAGLMALAGLAEEAGLFAGVRRRLAAMSPWLALWLSTLLVAVASAVLLNDAAVVVLVPFLLPMLIACGVPAVPAVTLLAVAANVGSLLTPFGNPQNAVLASAADLDVASFLIQQGPLVLLGFGILAVASAWSTRALARVAPSAIALPPHATPRGRPLLLASLGAFLVASAFEVLPLGALAALAALLAYALLRPTLGKDADRGVKRGFDANVLALFVGLYLLTGGLQSWFPADFSPGESLDGVVSATVAVTALSNTVGNVPAVLMLLRLDPAWTSEHAHFLVTTSTLGGALLLTGSAASLIAADQARRLGVDVRFLAFLRSAAVWVLPLLFLGAWMNW